MRWFHRLYAWAFGYKWGPCPLCGRIFGGHEKGNGVLMTTVGGVAVCAHCKDKAQKRNEWYMKTHPLPKYEYD